jgi:transcriptional regulator with XRE-family HTH domain
VNKLELKEFRKKYSLSVQDVADITKVSVFAVKNWESGNRNMSQSAIELINLYVPNSIQEQTVEYNQTDPAGKRLAEYVEMQGLSIREFGEKCGIGYNNTASHLKGSLPIGMSVLQKIKKGFPNLNTEWVLFGNGGMEINSGGNSQNSKEVEQLEQINYLLSNTIRDKEKTISSLENQIALMHELKEATTKDESPIKSNVAR